MDDPLETSRLDGLREAGYEIQTMIGRGGMAYVYRAQDTRLGRIVAVKVLAPELAQNEEFRLRFLRESRLAASLDHPNIIPIYEAGEASGHLYLAMRYVEGSDLKVMLKRRERLPLDETIAIFRQVAAALDTAHASGLVHRDVKPANILIAPGAGGVRRDHAYLADFGLTKRASSLSGVTATGIVVGTMDYVAPEQIGGKPVDARTDVYALGCVIYQALTGKVPFIRDDDAALLWAHLMEMPTPVSSIRPDVPTSVDEVMNVAMAKGVEGRFDSCGAFLEAFAAAVEGRPAVLPATSASSGAGAPVTDNGRPASAPPSGRATGISRVGDGAAAPASDQHAAGSGIQYPAAQYAPLQYSPGQPGQPAQQPSAGSHPNQYSPMSAPPYPQSGVPYPGSAPPYPGSAIPYSGVPYPGSAPPHPQSGVPYPGSAPPHPQSGVPYPGSAPPHSGQARPSGLRRLTTGRGRKYLIGGLATLLVLAIALVAVLALDPFKEGTKTFTANGQLPASFSYPETWKMAESGTSLAFSRKAAVANNLFSTPGAGADWSGMGDAVKDDPESAAGLYTLFQQQDNLGDTAKEQSEGLTNLLPSQFSQSKTPIVTVGGKESILHEGTLSAPDGSTRLHIWAVVVPNEAGQKVVFVFFSAEAAWDDNVPKFEAIVRSVTFPS